MSEAYLRGLVLSKPIVKIKNENGFLSIRYENGVYGGWAQFKDTLHWYIPVNLYLDKHKRRKIQLAVFKKIPQLDKYPRNFLVG